VSRFTYADADVMAKVETIRRGDRIYLPGFGSASRARVVAEVQLWPAQQVGDHTVPASYTVVYYTGEWSRPMRDDRGDAPEPELVRLSLKPHLPGDRLRVRRLLVTAAA
jgi:hypothetical protein